MNKIIWVLQIALALFFIAPGVMKMISSKEKMIEKNMVGPNDPEFAIRLIGIMELLGCLGILLPAALKIMPVLTPVAAIGFCIIMAGAFVVHLNKEEYKILPLMAVVFAISLTVACYRFTH